MGMGSRSVWLDSVRSQVDFAAAAPPRDRTGDDFDWKWFATRGPRAWAPPAPGDAFSSEWLAARGEPLWDVRERLADDTSRLVFDLHLVLRGAGPARFCFPRQEFADWLAVHGREPFAVEGLPADYLGRPLEVFDLTVADTGTRVRLVATALQVGLCNAFRQYVPTRGGTPLGPRPGDVVLDCGACIGDFGMLFAALAGCAGAVHLFDPVPLHIRYCRHQVTLNPHLGSALHPVQAAVGATNASVAGATGDVARVSPGGLAVDAYEQVSLDGYADGAGLARIDFEPRLPPPLRPPHAGEVGERVLRGVGSDPRRQPARRPARGSVGAGPLPAEWAAAARFPGRTAGCRHPRPGTTAEIRRAKREPGPRSPGDASRRMVCTYNSRDRCGHPRPRQPCPPPWPSTNSSAATCASSATCSPR